MIYHYGDSTFTGGGNLKFACFDRRVRVGYKNKKHGTTLSYKKVTCPICIHRLIDRRIEEAAYLGEMLKVHEDKFQKCQEGLIETKKDVLQNYKPDKEVLERIRRQIGAVI